jgi:NAD(P)-dependent dehydrogenase (short-subunit alcohol dehydrogenase family)
VNDQTEPLAGKVALVTGGGRGIGRAIALGLASSGVNVAILARTTEQLEQTIALAHVRSSPRGGELLAITGDVTHTEQTARNLRAIEDRLGPIQILVNNAAVVWPLGPSVAIDPVRWARAVDVNVLAPVRLTVTLLPAMLDAGWGRVINISSSVAANPAGMLRANAYTTTKAALEAHTLNLAAELDATGVTVNAYRPGGVDTAMQAYIRGQDPAEIGANLHQRFTANHAAGSLLTPEQSAASLLARISSRATGKIWDASDPVDETASERPASVRSDVV